MPDFISQGSSTSLFATSVQYTNCGSSIIFVYPSSLGKGETHYLNLRECYHSTLSDYSCNRGASCCFLAAQNFIKKELIVIEVKDNRVYATSIFQHLHGSPEIVYDGSLGMAFDPKVSPDGIKIALVLNKDLYILYFSTANDRVTDGQRTRLTYDGELAEISCGLSDYLSKEEIDRCK